MTRKRMLKVVPKPRPIPGQFYLTQVLKMEEGKHELVATLEHLSPEHRGRTTSARLPLPAYEDGLCAKFIAACGHPLKVEEEVDISMVVGAKIDVQFTTLPSASEWEAVEFRPVEKTP